MNLYPNFKKPNNGDVFLVETKNGYACGIVLNTSDETSPFYRFMPNCYMISFFDTCIFDTSSITPEVCNKKLLLNPCWTNAMGWNRRLFNNVINFDLYRNLIPDRYSFEDSFGRYFDNEANRIAYRIDPCGKWGVLSYRIIQEQAGEICAAY